MNGVARLLVALWLFSSLALDAIAQPDTLWTRCGDWYQSGALAATDDGGFVWCRTSENGLMQIDRFDATGNVRWSHSQTEAGWCDVEPRENGGFAVLSIGFFAPRITELSLNGQVETDREYSELSGEVHYHNWLRRLPGGGYVMAGESSPIMVRFAANGDTLWKRLLPLPFNAWNVAVWAEADTGFVIAGQQRIDALHSNLLLTKFNSAGDSLGARGCTIEGTFEMKSAVRAPSGSIYAAGSAPDVIKINSAGDTVWTRELPNWGESEVMTSVVATSEGGCIVAGYYSPIDLYGTDLIVAKFDSAGQCLWTFDNWPPRESMNATNIIQLSDGGYVVAAQVSTQDTTPRPVGSILYRFAADPLTKNLSPARRPNSFALSAFPNPFNPTTTLTFTLPKAGQVKITLFDITGRQIRTLSDKRYDAGEHSLQVNGTMLPSGIYFARLQSGHLAATQKLLLLK